MVDILVATYNGENYLSEQLDSLINQNYKNIKILISDDGSTDRTIEIIKIYEEQYPKIKLVADERIGGVQKNFERLLGFSTSDYIMFCDQDDVWEVDKVEKMLRELKLVEKRLVSNNLPVLLYSDLCLVDEKLDIIHDSFYNYNNINPMLNLNIKYLSWRSTIYGCTTIFNKKLIDVALPFPTQVTMHDHWLALNALKFGILEYVDIITIKYRQHSNNFVGGGKNSRFYKIKNFKKNIKKNKRGICRCKSSKFKIKINEK